MSRGHCILSHGFESGPDATKVTALTEVAERLGWTYERPDYRDVDARTDISPLGDVASRLMRLRGLAATAAKRGPVVLAGSSLGAYISGQVSLQVPTHGLFLLAPPTQMGTMPELDAAAVPVSIVHGWDDDLIPAAAVISWAHTRRARLMLVDDDHRLGKHVDICAEAFSQLLALL